MTRPHFQFWPRRLPHNISSPQTSLWYNLEVSARRYPDKDAIIFYGRHTTFRELHDDAVAVAGWLQQVAGVQKGDRVLLYMQNCPQFMAAYYGILRADAVVVPVKPRLNRPEEFKHYITECRRCHGHLQRRSGRQRDHGQRRAAGSATHPAPAGHVLRRCAAGGPVRISRRRPACVDHRAASGAARRGCMERRSRAAPHAGPRTPPGRTTWP